MSELPTQAATQAPPLMRAPLPPLPELHLQQVFQHAPIGMAVLDLEGRWLDVNAQFCRIVGYTREELLAREFRDITVPEDVADDDGMLIRLLAGQVPSYQREKRYIRKDGNVIWVELAVSLAKDARGYPACLITQIVDIHELKQANEAIRQRELMLDAILGALPVGVRLVGGDGRTLSANLASLQIWQGNGGPIVAEEQYRARDAGSGVELERDQWPVAQAVASGREIDARLLEITCFDDSRKTVLNAAVPIVDDAGETLGAVEVVQDMTRWLGLEKQLLQRTHDLEARNQELEQFAYVASHDLQEPLRKVSSFVQLFAKRYADKVDETGQSYLNFAVDGATRMQRLIDDLLHYSRVSRSGFDKTPVDLERVYKQVSQDLAHVLYESGGELRCGPLPVVLGEPLQMRALLQNLIANALKYRHPERRPLVEVSAETDADGLVTVHVKDNGIGIEERFFQRIFVIFQRLHSRAEYQGTGIGLAICKRVVENHGGLIWLESAPEQGSTFHFTMTSAGVEHEAG